MFLLHHKEKNKKSRSYKHKGATLLFIVQGAPATVVRRGACDTLGQKASMPPQPEPTRRRAYTIQPGGFFSAAIFSRGKNTGKGCVNGATENAFFDDSFFCKNPEGAR